LSKVRHELQRSQTAPTVIRTTPLPAEAAGFPPPVLPQQALPKKRGNTVIAVAIASLVLVSGLGLRILTSSMPAQSSLSQSQPSSPDKVITSPPEEPQASANQSPAPDIAPESPALPARASS